MSEPEPPTLRKTPAVPPPGYAAGGGVQPPAYGYPVQSAPYGQPMPAGPVGKVRSTGTCILLAVVTLGIYTWYWYYATHDEMKRHSGEGIGGGLALVLGILLGIVMPFLTANEVGDLYQRRGHSRPVSAVTGLWALLLGWFFGVGLIVWFVKTNGALNAYWRSLGAH